MCEVEAGGDGSERRKRKGSPHVEQTAAKRGERSDFHSDGHTILHFLHIFITMFSFSHSGGTTTYSAACPNDYSLETFFLHVSVPLASA